MKRWTLVPVVCGLLLGGLALVSHGVQAGENEEGPAEKKIEKKVKIVRFGGGGFLGVGLQDVEGDARGAEVRSVEPDSAAEKAGIEEGDVITRFDGVDVRSAPQLARLVRETPVGREVAVEVRRGGATKTLTATLAAGRHGIHAGQGGVFVPDVDADVLDFDVEDFDVDVPDIENPPHGAMPHVFRWHGDGDDDFTMRWSPERPRLGIRFQVITGQLADYFELSADEGVLVTSVVEDGPAAAGGVRAGDVVLEFDGKTIRDGGDVVKAVRSAEAGRPLSVRLQRDGKPLEVQVTLPEPEKPQKVLEHAAGVRL